MGELKSFHGYSNHVCTILQYRSQLETKFRKFIQDTLGQPHFETLAASLHPISESFLSITEESLCSKILSLESFQLKKSSEQSNIQSFRSRTQYDNESLDGFLHALRELARNCNFGNGDETKAEVRQQFILGLNNEKERNLAEYYADKSVEEIIRILETHQRIHSKVPLTRENLKMGNFLSFLDYFHNNCDGLLSWDSEPFGSYNYHQFQNFRHPEKPKSSPALGIEGRNNSCYMDTSLMALFMYNDSFQDSLQNSVESLGSDVFLRLCDTLHHQKRLRLASGIITEFRELMSKKICSDYKDKQMDSEVFLTSLFGKVLHADPFFKIVDGHGGFVLQLVGSPEMSGTGVTVQDLLQYTFTLQSIQLETIPKPGLILKLPYTDGRPVLGSVLPNRELSLQNILYCGGDAKLVLSAVICLRHNHNTVFLRTSSGIEEWVHLDSFQFGKDSLVPNLSTILSRDKHTEAPTWNWGVEADSAELMEYLCKFAYMCFYVQEEDDDV